MIDNLLYPMLVGKKIRLHTVPVFLAIVGGLSSSARPAWSWGR